MTVDAHDHQGLVVGHVVVQLLVEHVLPLVYHVLQHVKILQDHPGRVTSTHLSYGEAKHFLSTIAVVLTLP